MNAFEDRIAIVTGGASGIGRAMAEGLCERGARVIVADIDDARAREAAAALGSRATAAAVDVADAAAVQAVVDRAVTEHGRLDYMFNNAGFAVGGEVLDMTLEHWYRILDVNLRGVIHGIHAAYPIMARQGDGHIVNTASLAGLIPFPTGAAYAATKHAVVGLSRSLRAEAAPHGVRVSVVCPGFVDTNIFGAATYVNYDGERARKQLGANLMTPARAAKAILRGVARNKETILVTGHAHALYGIQRYAPSMLGAFVRNQARLARRFRRE